MPEAGRSGPPPRLRRRPRFEAGLFHAVVGWLAGGSNGYGGVLESQARRQRDGSLPCPRCSAVGFVPLRISADLARCTGCATVYSVHRPATLGELIHGSPFDAAPTDARAARRNGPGPRR
jgi:hypothetical protein